MQNFYKEFKSRFIKKFNGMNINILKNGCNLGTANAISLCWRNRKKNQHCVKMDDDVIIYSDTWIDQMEEVLERQPKIGIVGLKRKDLEESPKNNITHFRSELVMLDHERGQKWIVVERVKHVFGTVQLYNSSFLDKVGYLTQPTQYGFDDSLMAARCDIANFVGVFLPHIEIDHIDIGGNNYTHEKAKHAGETMEIYSRWRDEYYNGMRDIYAEPDWNELENKIESANNR